MHPNRILSIVVGAVVLLGVAAAIVAATRPAPQIDVSTPEGVVQAYLQDVFEGNEEAAIARIDPASGCDAADLDRAFASRSVRVVLVDTTSSGSTARVEVRMTYTGDGPFAASEYSEEQQFELRGAGASWLITGDPWPMFFCEGGKP
ncbi:MAG: hypothetical protein WB239_12065 [Acidimicrobiia bacterium]